MSVDSSAITWALIIASVKCGRIASNTTLPTYLSNAYRRGVYMYKINITPTNFNRRGQSIPLHQQSKQLTTDTMQSFHPSIRLICLIYRRDTTVLKLHGRALILRAFIMLSARMGSAYMITQSNSLPWCLICVPLNSEEHSFRKSWYKFVCKSSKPIASHQYNSKLQADTGNLHTENTNKILLNPGIAPRVSRATYGHQTSS